MVAKKAARYALPARSSVTVRSPKQKVLQGFVSESLSCAEHPVQTPVQPPFSRVPVRGFDLLALRSLRGAQRADVRLWRAEAEPAGPHRHPRSPSAEQW